MNSINSPGVRIYTTDYCGFCTRAKRFLQQRGVAFEEIDVSNDDRAREELVRTTGQRTVPQVFIGGRSVGGYSDLLALEASGELEDLLRGAPKASVA